MGGLARIFSMKKILSDVELEKTTKKKKKTKKSKSDVNELYKKCFNT